MVNPADLARVASVGLRTRRLRAALSALGIAIGVAAIVAVLGLSSSSSAGLLAEIDRLGTNLLTVSSGQTLTGTTAELPTSAPAMIARIAPVIAVQHTGTTKATAFRSPLIPSIETNGLSVRAASLGLPAAISTSVAHGGYLNAATQFEPVAVLGAAAAQRLGFDTIWPGARIWVGDQWFYLAGILNPAVLAPEIDSAVLIGYPAAHRYLGFDGHPSTVYVRARTGQVTAVQQVLADTANPESRGGQHHGDLGARAQERDRVAPGARGDQGRHPGPVPGRGDLARRVRRHGRRGGGGGGHCRLRRDQRLGGCHPGASLGRRHRRRGRDRRHRRPGPGHQGRPHATDRGAPRCVTSTS
jgi:hypothetical protein